MNSKKSSIPFIIAVPKMSADELLKCAEEKLNPTHKNFNLATWDFYKSRLGKAINCIGKKYAVLCWMPKRRVTSSEVHNYFNGCGFDGNVGAFWAWIIEKNPVGSHISLPNDDDHLFANPAEANLLYAPWYFRDKSSRKLYLTGAHPIKFEKDDVFVGFREI